MTQDMQLNDLMHPRRELKRWIDMRTLRRERDTLRPADRPSRRDTSGERLLIVPCDPWSLDGSKGDEAMMLGAVGKLRKTLPGLDVAIVVASEPAADRAREHGFRPLFAWDGPLEDSLHRLEEFAPQRMFVLGADVMDGYYNPVTSSRLLLLADLMATRGVKVSVLGFSFNGQPSTHVRPVFDGLDARTALHVRDSVSLGRFRAFSSAPARLVADAAFMLEPDDSPREVRELAAWTDRQRQAGRTVLGFNMHPMLIRHATPQQVEGMVRSGVAALRQVAQSRPVAIALISHDYRGHEGDDVCLKPIFEALHAELGDRLAYPTQRFSAAQLKAMAGLMDGVVTGRMHLAIATLGMGKPVVGLTYQDKFHGLLAHFDYPQRYLLSAAELEAPERLAATIEDLVDHIEPLRRTVVERLPEVKKASARNLEPLA
jgi:polysaccharide pyruvyl transferase WcaK-like protein